MNFNEKLRELRKNSSYSQKALADALGISVKAYQYYEAGRTEPKIEGLKTLAYMFGITVDELICYNPESSLMDTK